MAEGSSHHNDRLLLLSKVKKLCLCFLPLFLGYLFLQNTLNIDEPLAVSTGRSMEPSIHEGDILVFRGVSFEEIEVGDVILFEVPEEMGELLPPRITHRVIEVRRENGETFLRTKGDNAPLDTYEIPASNVVGLNVAVIPYVGLPLLFAQRPVGIIVILFLVVAPRFRGYEV
jgi:signal peptidase I